MLHIFSYQRNTNLRTIRHDSAIPSRLLKLTSLTIHMLVKTRQLKLPFIAGGNSNCQIDFQKLFWIKQHIFINSEPVVLLLNTHLKEVYVNEILTNV